MTNPDARSRKKNSKIKTLHYVEPVEQQYHSFEEEKVTDIIPEIYQQKIENGHRNTLQYVEAAQEHNFVFQEEKVAEFTPEAPQTGKLSKVGGSYPKSAHKHFIVICVKSGLTRALH